MALLNGTFLWIFIVCFFVYTSASAQLLSTPGGRIFSTSSGKILATGATFSEVAILSISGVTDNTATINATATSTVTIYKDLLNSHVPPTCFLFSFPLCSLFFTVGYYSLLHFFN